MKVNMNLSTEKYKAIKNNFNHEFANALEKYIKTICEKNNIIYDPENIGLYRMCDLDEEYGTFFSQNRIIIMPDLTNHKDEDMSEDENDIYDCYDYDNNLTFESKTLDAILNGNKLNITVAGYDSYIEVYKLKDVLDAIKNASDNVLKYLINSEYLFYKTRNDDYKYENIKDNINTKFADSLENYIKEWCNNQKIQYCPETTILFRESELDCEEGASSQNTIIVRANFKEHLKNDNTIDYGEDYIDDYDSALFNSKILEALLYCEDPYYYDDNDPNENPLKIKHYKMDECGVINTYPLKDVLEAIRNTTNDNFIRCILNNECVFKD